MAAFDLYILKRPGAENSYNQEAQARAKTVADALDDAAVERLTRTIAAGLPGSTTDALILEAFRDRLAAYQGIDAVKLRKHLIEFLEQVTPVADSLSLKLTLHPDDPPRPLSGFPVLRPRMRIMPPCSRPCRPRRTACVSAQAAQACGQTTTFRLWPAVSHRAFTLLISGQREVSPMG